MSEAERAEQLSIAKCELASEVLLSFGNLRFAATGWSMLPTIWPGDTLVVQRVNADQVCAGDIILAKREGRFCAHRVMEWGEHRITRGDGMRIPDPPIEPEELLGRVSYVIRDGKCVELPEKPRALARVAAFVIQRSHFAARALVWLYGLRSAVGFRNVVRNRSLESY